MLITLKITNKFEGAFTFRELKVGNGRNSALVDVGEAVHAILTTSHKLPLVDKAGSELLFIKDLRANKKEHDDTAMRSLQNYAVQVALLDKQREELLANAAKLSAGLSSAPAFDAMVASADISKPPAEKKARKSCPDPTPDASSSPPLSTRGLKPCKACNYLNGYAAAVCGSCGANRPSKPQ